MAALEEEVRALINQQRLAPDAMPCRAQLLDAGAIAVCDPKHHWR